MKLVLKISIMLLTTCMFMQAQYPTTPNLGLTLPPYNTANWNTFVNTNFSLIDTAVGSLQGSFQGSWSFGVTYSKGQIVNSGGILYQSIVNNNLNNTPATSPSFWTVFFQAVVSINGTSGLYTFTGSGVNCTGTTCTFNSSSGVSSVANGDSTLTISPNSGSVIASLNLSHANNWTALQTFGNNISIGSVIPTGATGTGNIVFSLSPTFTGTVIANNLNLTGTPTFSGIAGAGTYCLQVNSSGILSNTGAPCTGGVSSVANSDSSLTVSPNTGSVIASLNTGHANTFTAVQQAPNIILHLKDYGAVCDGAHQSADTTAITNAFTAMGSTGATVIVPAGTCQFNNSSGALSETNISGTLEGEGPGASIVFSTLGTDGIDFTTPTNLTIRDMAFSYGPTATARTSGYPLSFAQATGLKLINLTLTNGNLSAVRVSSSTNVYLENITMSNFEANGLFLINNKYLSANGIHSSNNGDAPFEVSWYDSEYSAHSVPCQFVTMTGLTSYNDVHGIIVDGCLDVSISNFDIASTQHDAIEVQQSSAISAAAWPDNVTISNGTIRDTGYSSGALNEPTINAITIFTSNVPPGGTYQHVELNNVILRHIGGECVRENDNTSFIVAFNNIDCDGAGATGTTGSNGRFQAGFDLNGYKTTFNGVNVSNSGGPALYLFDSVFVSGSINTYNPNSTGLTTNAIYNNSTGNIQLGVNIIDLEVTDASKITDAATSGSHFFGPITVSTSNTWAGTSSANTGGVTQFILNPLAISAGTNSLTLASATLSGNVTATFPANTGTVAETNLSQNWSATQSLSGLTLSGITGSTQCLHVNASGVVSGTSADCGSSGGITGATNGQPLTATGVTTATSRPIYYDAKAQGTTDITTDLVAQYAVTSNVSQTTQGNGYTGTQAGSVNPFNAFSATSDIAITTDFGPYTINANAAWTVVGNDVLTRGHGQNGNSVLTLNNGGSFPANTTLLTIGNNTNLPFSDRVENWRINCGTASSTAPCVLINSGQEGTGFRDTTFIGTNVSSASSPVLQISGTNGSDHGEYRGLSILNTGTGNDAIQFTITTGTNSYEGNIVSRLTGNNTSGAHTGNACIHQVGTSFQSWNYVIGMHCEDFTYGVEVGNNTGIGGIGLEATGTLTDVLHIDTGGVVGGTAVVDIRDNSSSVTNLVNDIPNGRTLTNANYTFAGGHFLAGYFSGTTAFGGLNYQTNSYSSAHTANINEFGIVSTAAMTLTVPHALTMQYWHATNESSGTLTIACDTGNINGSATVTMSQYQQADVWADGTNCWAGLPGTGGGSVSLTSSAGTLTLSPSPITGTGTLDINLGNANTWTALQTFGTHISIGGVTASGATGTGNIVFATSPTLTTPLLGTPTSGVITNLTGTCTSCNVGGNAATVTTSVSSTNSSFSILAAASTSGSQAPVTVASFTINPSTGAVTLPSVSATSATFTGSGIPIATGTSSNSDLAGFITLSGGTGTYTFSATYVTSPVCVATDTTATNAVQASTTTTVLTVNGTSTDVIAYHCIGRT